MGTAPSPGLRPWHRGISPILGQIKEPRWVYPPLKSCWIQSHPAPTGARGLQGPPAHSHPRGPSALLWPSPALALQSPVQAFACRSFPSPLPTWQSSDCHIPSSCWTAPFCQSCSVLTSEQSSKPRGHPEPSPELCLSSDLASGADVEGVGTEPTQGLDLRPQHSPRCHRLSTRLELQTSQGNNTQPLGDSKTQKNMILRTWFLPYIDFRNETHFPLDLCPEPGLPLAPGDMGLSFS